MTLNEHARAYECTMCGAGKGEPCKSKEGRLRKSHRERLGFFTTSFRIGLLRDEKALLEKQLCDGRKNMLKHYSDELWTVNEALRFAGVEA